MYVPFNEMPDAARIWIYQSDRPLQISEVEHITGVLHQFTENWAAHGVPLRASFTIRHQRFIILAADESHHAASGCSIDASVGIIKKLEQDLHLNLFDRLQIAFRTASGMVVSAPAATFKKLIAAGDVLASTLVFNNMAQTIGALKSEWEIPASQSWHKRFFNPMITS
jgi:hypothetical protein